MIGLRVTRRGSTVWAEWSLPGGPVMACAQCLRCRVAVGGTLDAAAWWLHQHTQAKHAPAPAADTLPFLT